MLSRLRRELAFARHIPPSRILRRAALRLQLATESWRGWSPEGDARLSETAPLPLFRPRQTQTRRTADGWRFSFLGRERGCGPTVDWGLPGGAEEDRLWAMNLHYFEHSEALATADWAELVRQWIAANPGSMPRPSWAAWNPFSLSIRLVSWLQQLVLRQSELEPQLADIVAGSAASQLRFLERRLETDIGGNHLFKNILALIWGSAALRCDDAGRWRSLGLRLLERELGQFLADGVHFERSISYHAQVMGDLLSIRHALRGDVLAGRIDRAILKGVQAAVDLAHPDGLCALFGDSGLTMARSPDELERAAATMTGPMPSRRTDFAFEDAGYFGVRDAAGLLVVDAGPLGPDALPGHAHGDMFSFEWSLDGERLIVDQGVFEYVAGTRRQASRSAWSHNTVAAPDADQGDFFGAFRLGRRCRLRSREHVVGDGRLQLQAEHSGFIGQAGARHQRRIEATPTAIRIEDRLSRPVKGACANLLLGPDVTVARNPDASLALVGARAKATLRCHADVRVENAVWWPDMGVEVPTRRLRIPLSGAEGWFELKSEDAR